MGLLFLKLQLVGLLYVDIGKKMYGNVRSYPKLLLHVDIFGVHGHDGCCLILAHGLLLA